MKKKKRKCIFCKSVRIVKRGIRYNDSGEKQMFLCNKCGKKFTPEPRRLRFPEKEIIRAAKLHRQGYSLAEVQIKMKLRGYKISRWSISLWSKKYK